jgi:peptidoglycan/LPS O-acetylase OafA/YrhL
VVLVLGYHLYLFNGGRIGVALFFVLSGYLITGLLLAEHEKLGRISLRRFYERRVRRLLPALLGVLCVTIGLMWLQGRFEEVLFQATAVIFYVANIAMPYTADWGYLGHTWSLALEEQFYLTWPLLIVLARARRIILIAVAVLVVELTVIGRILAPGVEATALWSLYRVDAVAAGCLLALVPLRLPSWATTVGWGALALTLFFPDPPAWWSSGLTIACALIVAGAGPGWLSSRPLVRLGQISYGLYLWHVMTIGLLKGEIQADNPIAIATAVVVSLALALASERWIERPWRRSNHGDPSASGSRDASAPSSGVDGHGVPVDGSSDPLRVALC